MRSRGAHSSDGGRGREKLAAPEGKSVDAVPAAELRDLVSAQSEWLASVIPGLGSVLAWPY